MTREWLASQLGMLSVLRGVPEDPSVYFAALSDIPESVLRRAIAQALRTRTWFPTPAEIRLDCDVVAEPLEPVPTPYSGSFDLKEAYEAEIKNPLGGPSIIVKVTKDWVFDCQTCQDTGWAAFFCGEQPQIGLLVGRSCLRQHPHGPHAWVDPCVCIDRNPTIQRRKASRAKYASEPAKVA